MFGHTLTNREGKIKALGPTAYEELNAVRTHQDRFGPPSLVKP